MKEISEDFLPDLSTIIEERSILNNRWVVSQKSYEFIETIKKTHNLSYLTASVLASRNIPIDKIEQFLNPDLKTIWRDPEILPDLLAAVNFLLEIIRKKGKVGILGDYDVDGTSSCAFWHDIFEFLQLETFIWIPNREEGYGPSKQASDFFKEKGVDVLILVDCGSNSHTFASEYGKPIIVIDHHPVESIIEGGFVINPFRKDSNHLELVDFQKLCATGLSFMVAWYVLKKLDELSENSRKKILLNTLDLVALATVCDVMEMNSINRAFIAKGLQVIEKQERLGLRYLMRTANVHFPITTRNIGFTIGPRLNAAGRVDDPIVSFKILTTKDNTDAMNLADRLEELNRVRQTLQSEAVDEAISMAKDCSDKKVICVASDKWHHGVIGIIAGILKDKFGKPAIVGAIVGDRIKASGRSFSSMLHIGHVVQRAVLENVISSGGGHAQAAGISCSFEEWHNFSEWIHGHIEDEIFEKEAISIDAIVTFDQIEFDYKKIAPHGSKNPEVMVLIKDILVIGLVKGSWIRCSVQQDGRSYNLCVYTKHKPELEIFLDAALREHRFVDIVVKLQETFSYSIEDARYSLKN